MFIKGFSGGYCFKGFAGQPADKLITLPVPRKVVIPLSQGFGSSLEPKVKVADKVRAGEIIAGDGSIISSPIHASINGRVTAIEKKNYFSREVTMVTIEGDGSDGYQRINGYSDQWEKLSAPAIEELLYCAGVTALDRQGIPTHFKSSIITSEQVDDLIIHGIGSEVYNTSQELLLDGKNLLNFVEGIKILKKIMPQAMVHLALNKDKKKIIEEVRKLTANLEKFEIYTLTPKYPQGYDEVLVPTLLGKKFPYGYSAANIGIVVLNVQAVLHAYEAVVEGKPLIERIVALCGPCVKEPLHLKVRVGTPWEEILKGRIEGESSRVVLNSLLTGAAINDFSLPMDKTCSQVIAIPENRERKFLAFVRPGLNSDSFSNTFLAKLLPWAKKTCESNAHGEGRPCISCNYCERVCPVSIIPHLIAKYISRNIVDEVLLDLRIYDCIECGLCSYVCPSKIALTKYIKDGHAKLTTQGCVRGQCILPYFDDLKGIDGYRGAKQL